MRTPMRRILAASAAGACVVIGSLSMSSNGGASTGHGRHWTGFGADLKYWVTAHPKNSFRCPDGGCYGVSEPKNSAQYDQFITVSTGAGRVIAYTQVFLNSNGSIPEARAEALVLQLLPRDSVTTAIWVNRDNLGNTCLFWNIRSKTLATWFKAKGVDDPQGVVGVELASYPSATNPNGLLSDSAAVANEASVGIAPISKGIGC